MTDIDYSKLVDELLSRDTFREQVVQQVSRQFREDTKKSRDHIAGQIKTELEQHYAQYKRDRQKEIRDDLDAWFFGHMKRQIEKNKTDMLDRLNKEVERWMNEKLETSFKDAGRYVVEQLIRDKFSDVQMTFTIGDLFKGRYD